MTENKSDVLADSRVFLILREIAENSSIKISDIEGKIGCWRTLNRIMGQLEENGIVRTFFLKKGRHAPRYELTDLGYAAFLLLDMGNSMIRGTFDIQRNDVIGNVELLVEGTPTQKYRRKK